MCDTPAMLRELKVVERRYQAVLQVLDGILVAEAAERFGVARQTVHRWVARYRDNGLAGLADWSRAPKAHPWRTISAMPGLFPCGGAGGMIFRIVPRNARCGGHQSRLRPQQATLASDRGAEDLRYGLVTACFGLTVNVALRVARSPVWNAPAQPTTW